MHPEQALDVDHLLHDCLVEIVRRDGPQPLPWLVARARKEQRHARIDAAAVIRVVECATLLVPQPDGRIAFLADVLDGIVLTQRVRSPLAGRTDLWARCDLQPLLVIAAVGAIPLASGGEVTRMHSGHDVLVGPTGWLPDVPRFGLVALRLDAGALSVSAVEDADLPNPQEQHHVRRLIADHYRRERWWGGGDDLESRPGELVRALALARMEDPDLLSRPYAPLDELLYNPLQRDVDEHHWRDFAAARQDETVSMQLGDIPVALHMELSARARMYGMSFDQFVIAILGHLAWRTPFAEDCEPCDDFWDPERNGPAKVVSLRPGPVEQ